MLYRYGNKWALAPHKINYTERGKEYERRIGDKQWWLDFERRWDFMTINEITDIEHTEEQKRRLKEVEYFPEDFGHIYSEYVEYGTFGEINELPKDHPFRIIYLENESIEQGIELSQREINEIMNGIQLSDLEIRLMLGGL